MNGKSLHAVAASVLAPPAPLSVSQWADTYRRLSSKGSAAPGRWRTERNPLTREPMDCFSAGSPTRDVVLMWPVQSGKTEIALNIIGEAMVHQPGPIMVCLPGEVGRDKWVTQKLQPMIEETAVVRATLTTTASRESANTRVYKDFRGGQIYLEHAGSPSRLKSTSVRLLIVDELDEFSANFVGGDDPLQMLNGRTSAFPSTYRRLYISTPQIKASSRIHYLWERSDQRRYHVPCPHCGALQPLDWVALQWDCDAAGNRRAWIVCRECAAHIEEHYKPAMLRAGQWVASNPTAKLRGYHSNCLYYAPGLGPRWATLVDEWLDAQGDPARMKTFVNDRLAEPWEDAGARSVRANVVAERAEPYPLRMAPYGVARITAGIDTQDNRLCVQLVGWGAGRAWWVLDYVELPGDPALDAVWLALADMLNSPIEHASGATMHVDAAAIDIGGHRTEHVKAWVRARHTRRPMAIHGAVPNNAPVLGRGKLADVNWRGQYDKAGVMLYAVGTVAAKHVLYATLAADADAADQWQRMPDGPEKPQMPERRGHFSDQLPAEFFAGLISEAFNPTRNRFERIRGSSANEPLDTWVYAYAATHHPELRLHRATSADWARWADAIERSTKQTEHEEQRPARPARPALPARLPGVNAGRGFAVSWRG